MNVIDSKELYEFLKSKNIINLYHANSVSTSCSFLNLGGLSSRGFIEKLGLNQTPQDTDRIDKQFGVWNDIFLDVFDLHGFFPRQNFYGPVCFVIDSKIWLDSSLPNVKITTNNPIHWTQSATKYLNSVEEYKIFFDVSCKENTIQRKMITIEAEDYILPFDKYLVKILLDDPGVKNYYIDAKKKLIEEISKSGLKDVSIVKRICNNKCYCQENYRKYSENQFDKFFY